MDPERILGALVRDALMGGGGMGRHRRHLPRRRRSGGSVLGPGMKGMLGMGALGVAIAAFDHFMKQQKGAGAQSFAGAPTTAQPVAGVGPAPPCLVAPVPPVPWPGTDGEEPVPSSPSETTVPVQAPATKSDMNNDRFTMDVSLRRIQTAPAGGPRREGECMSVPPNSFLGAAQADMGERGRAQAEA